MKDFFIDKYEYDLQTNKRWINKVIQQEEGINDFIIKSLSHILNVHHIWNSRLLGTQPESGLWDKLPLDYATKFAVENRNVTISYLETWDHEAKVDFHDSEGTLLSKDTVDILYHILNHSNYHRAQVARELRTLGLEVPSFNFITFH
ncbi:MAG: DinB family protein [Crocinitomicaceae bacterium]